MMGLVPLLEETPESLVPLSLSLLREDMRKYNIPIKHHSLHLTFSR